MDFGYHISMCARSPATAKHINFCSGPTSYAAHVIQQNRLVSSFRTLFKELMLRHIRKCTITEGQRVTGNDKCSVSLDELDKLIGLVVAQGIITFPIKNLWSAT